ncbi:hypothetical protein TrRE_jg3652 [Triparma retinervis]|uniref:Bifunctional lysine-specific demethylase and histidyl-hydroxylase n=1 Tax=Triparma retinervis TaxID=2557542 RepID=A0A9W6ZXI6_9STRA|nr:hypothetical protein TrRE_jg3652 [Triparma retinervis]
MDMGVAEGEEDPSMKSVSGTLLSTLLEPVAPSAFFSTYFEKKPLHLARSADPDYPHEPLLTRKDVEEMLLRQSLRYGVDLNVTNVVDGVRRTLDLLPSAGEDPVVAEAKDVMSNLESGCSVRLLCPQMHSDDVWELCSILETTFGCMVGANAYLTPTASQGFAPHYDDVDVFILQQEGKKRWRVYPPLKGEVLPRKSSRDFREDEIGKPVLDVVLGEGDLLYLPRGWIHQAVTTREDTHSLHLTVSCMQDWSWSAMLEEVLPEAIKRASGGAGAESEELRGGMPRDFLEYMGVMHDNDWAIKDVRKNGGTVEGEERTKVRKRTQFRKLLKSKLSLVLDSALRLADWGADEMGKSFLWDRLPPAYSEEEKADTSDGQPGAPIFPETMVRISRDGIARVVVEGDKAVVYHCGDNERKYHGNPLSPLDFELDDAPAIECLFKTVAPRWIAVKDLPHPPAEDFDDKVDIVKALFEEGIVAIRQVEGVKRR